MVNYYHVVQLLHKDCDDSHTEDRHRYDAIVYSNFINDRGLQWTAEQVAGAIIAGLEVAELLCDPSCCHGCEVCSNFGCMYDTIVAERNGFPPVS